MIFFKKVILGFVVGTAAIIPGLSGGVLAAILGIYEPIMAALSGFFKNFKKNALFLLPYALGGVAGFVLLGGIIDFLMEYAETQVLFLFAGLVIGGFPALIREANKEGFKIHYLFVAAVAFFFMLSFGEILGNPPKTPFLKYLLGGTIYSFGSIIPGISASFILINMGIYREILSSLFMPQVILPFFLGFIITSIILIKGINYLFKRFHSYSYYCVLGLLLASIITALPAISNPLIDIPVLISGILLGFFII